MSGAQVIACPAAPGDPLHFADYDRELEFLDCARCGRIPCSRLGELLADEMARFEAQFPALGSPPAIAADESEVARVAELLFRALRRDPALAVELLLGFAARSLGGRLPEAHVEMIVERVLERTVA